MQIVVVPDHRGGGWVQPVDETGTPSGPAESVADLPAAIARRESAESPRWIWADCGELYPALVEAGIRVQRCHDLALTESLLLGYTERWGEPRSVAAAHARLHGRPVPPDRQPLALTRQPVLFEPQHNDLPPTTEPLEAAVEVYADQIRRIAEVDTPKAFELLVAIDSACGLTAVEMTAAGIPWRIDVHNDILTELLGTRTRGGVRPAKLAELAAQVTAAFGGRTVNPDSPADLVAAFARDGHALTTTRSWVLKQIDHPAVQPVLAYKELSRIHTAHGWSWQSEWVHGGRFRPEYIPAGVVSGRWATRGGGALQIPRRLRKAVIADPDHLLILADAGQLEPRVLAAMSRDGAMARAAQEDDLYAALAAESFGGDRDTAKVGLLGAMYGQTGGQAAAPLATLRRRYPAALGLLEEAARSGERGELVRSHLGRTCPPSRREELEGEAARARGRFTRNFVVQATAAEWAGALLASLRLRLRDLAAHGSTADIVFFQHDEVVVHVARAHADAAADAVLAAGDDATRLLFGPTPVRFPLHTAAVECYADGEH